MYIEFLLKFVQGMSLYTSKCYVTWSTSK